MDLHHKAHKIILVTLIVTFIGYNYAVYTQDPGGNSFKMTQKAISGEILFQKNNCIACHQLYGLGGYLGPDLTNVISVKGKGSNYVKAFLNSGVKSMPKFSFSEEELDAIVQFLTEVDKTGIYPNYNAKKKMTGWVELELKGK